MAQVTPRFLAIVAVACALPAASLSAQSNNAAIDHALDRTVKLYGLGAGMEAGYGSGVLISSDGDVLTVLSLLIDARRIKVVMRDGVEYQAQVVRRDAQRQIALLHISGPFISSADPPASGGDVSPKPVGPFPYFEVDPTIHVLPGDTVFAIGNPFHIAEGAEVMSVARGVLSARIPLDATRRAGDFPYHGDVLVTDAITSNPGFPGGALVDAEGRLLGVIGREVQLNGTRTHLNYAMPADVLAAFLSDRNQSSDAASPAMKEPPKPVDLGLRLARTGYRKQLAFVDRVVPGSPAAAAGMHIDDLILSIGGRQVPDIAAYDAILPTLRPGETIELVVRRDKQIVTIALKLPDAPPPSP